MTCMMNRNGKFIDLALWGFLPQDEFVFTANDASAFLNIGHTIISKHYHIGKI